MKAQMLLWWRERSLREQRMLLAMAALLAVTIVWLGVYRPLQSGLSSSRERHQLAVVRLGEVRADAAALRGLGRPAALPGPLVTVVAQSANEAGFATAMVAAQGEQRVTVSIASARPAAAFTWIAALEARGIIVERLAARANSDPTLALDLTLAGGR
jgi:general secretion pathway protein M